MPSDDKHLDLVELRASVERACQPTFAPYIIEGRNRIAAMPRKWVLENIEAVARSVLNFSDKEWGYWEYGRFLEVLDVIGARELLDRMIVEGLASVDGNVRELAKCWPKSEDR